MNNQKLPDFNLTYVAKSAGTALPIKAKGLPPLKDNRHETCRAEFLALLLALP
jgi:hypothetical protein